MILPPFDAEDDPANSASVGHRTVAGLLSEEREQELERQDRELDKAPAEAPRGPCKTCSRLYRGRRARCPICGFWKGVL